jgi:hypothetical protein
MAGASDHGKGGAIVGILYSDFRGFPCFVSEIFTAAELSRPSGHESVLILQRESSGLSIGTELAWSRVVAETR